MSSSELMLRRFVPVPIKLVLILVGNDVHIASMEFLECFSHSRLLMVVPEFLRTLVFARPRGDDQFADCTFSPSLDMSR